MTHYTILVKYEGNIYEAEDKVAEMLEPYDENKEGPKRKVYLGEGEIQQCREHYKKKQRSPSGVTLDSELSPKEIEDYFGVQEVGKDRGDRKTLSGYYYHTTYNENSRWDWWEIGGRWQGILLKLKRGATGMWGSLGLRKGKPSGVDIAYLKDIVLNGFVTHAVLDADGWHEWSKMGWWAVTYDETEDRETWEKKFAERFLSNPTDRTVIAIVDAHI